MLLKYLILPILSLFALIPAVAQNNWSWAEIPYDKISSHIVSDNETLWVATAGGGVYRYDHQDNTYQHFTRVNDGISDNFIYDMALDAEKNLWLATVEGLSVIRMILGIPSLAKIHQA